MKLKLGLEDQTIAVVDKSLNLLTPSETYEGVDYYDPEGPDANNGYSIWVTGVPGQSYDLVLKVKLEAMPDGVTTAATHYLTLVGQPVKILGVDADCPDGSKKQEDGTCKCDNPYQYIDGGACRCEGEMVADGTNTYCFCEGGQLWTGTSCIPAKDCVDPRVIDGVNCRCPVNEKWDGGTRTCTTLVVCEIGEEYNPLTKSCNIIPPTPDPEPPLPAEGGGGCSCSMCYH